MLALEQIRNAEVKVARFARVACVAGWLALVSSIVHAAGTPPANTALLDRAGQVAASNGVPSLLFYSLIDAESGWRHLSVSEAGAIGLTQLMPDTAEELRVNPYLVNDNLQGGARYLGRMIDRFGDWRLALAAYNAGPGTVSKHEGVPPFDETRTYVARVLKGMRAPGLLSYLSKVPANACPSAAVLETSFEDLKVVNLYWNYEQVSSFALAFVTPQCVAVKREDLDQDGIAGTARVLDRRGWLLLSHTESTEVYHDETAGELFLFSGGNAYFDKTIVAPQDRGAETLPSPGALVDYRVSTTFNEKDVAVSSLSANFELRRSATDRIKGRLRLGRDFEVSDAALRFVRDRDDTRLEVGTLRAPDVPGRSAEQILGVSYLSGASSGEALTYAPESVGFSDPLAGVVRVYSGDRLLFEKEAPGGPKDVQLREFPIESGDLRYEFENILGDVTTKEFEYLRIPGLLPQGARRRGAYLGLKAAGSGPSGWEAAEWVAGGGYEVGLRERVTAGIGGYLSAEEWTLRAEARGRSGADVSWAATLSHVQRSAGASSSLSARAVVPTDAGWVDDVALSARWEAGAGAARDGDVELRAATGVDWRRGNGSVSARWLRDEDDPGHVELAGRLSLDLEDFGSLGLSLRADRAGVESEIGFLRSWRLGSRSTVTADVDWRDYGAARDGLMEFASHLRVQRQAQSSDGWSGSLQARRLVRRGAVFERTTQSVNGDLRLPVGLGVLTGFARVDDAVAGTRLQGRLSFDGRAVWAGGTLAFGRPSGLQTLYVDANGVADLPITVNAREVGRTNQRGVFLGDVVMKGRRNVVKIEKDSVPIEYSIDDAAAETTLWPEQEGVYRVEFPLVENVPALVVILDKEGAPLPGGLLLLGEGESSAYVIADGRTYLDNARQFRRGEVVDADGAVICTISLDGDEIDSKLQPGVVANLGEVACT